MPPRASSARNKLVTYCTYAERTGAAEGPAQPLHRRCRKGKVLSEAALVDLVRTYAWIPMLCLPMLVVLSGAPELSAPRLSEYVDQCEEYVAHNITWHQVEDKCGCARSLGSKGIVPYLEWHYCDFGCSSASAALSFVLCGAWLLILFSTVAST